MNCQSVVDALSDYLDGSLAGHELRLIEAHLGQCPHCHVVRLDLAEIRQAARELPLRTPPRALWVRIQREIEVERPEQGGVRETAELSTWWERLMARRFTFTLPQLAGAVALAMALIAFALVSAYQQNTSGTGPGLRGATASVLLPGEEEIKGNIERRMNAINARLSSWDPQMRELFERHVATLDSSLHNCRQSLMANPQDKDHQQMLRALYEEKLQLLDTYDKLK
jgi:hypothetical protein